MKGSISSCQWIVAIISFGCVSCVVINVRRAKQDIFSNPPFKKECGTDPEEKCSQKNAHAVGLLEGFCSCGCKYSYSTFLEKRLGCVSNAELRNAQSHTTWVYALSQDIGGRSHPISVLDVVSSRHNIITFTIKGDYFSRGKIQSCDPYAVEIFNHTGEWMSVNYAVVNRSIDTTKIENTGYIYNPLLNWKKEFKSTSKHFVGKVMRIKIKCTGQKDNNNVTTNDFIIFKTEGQFRVVVPDNTSSSASSHRLMPTVTSPVSSVTKPTSPAKSYRSTSTVTTTAVYFTSTVYKTSTTAGISSAIHPTSVKEKLQTLLSSYSVSSDVVLHTTPMSDLQTNDPSVGKTVAGVVVGIILVLIIIALIILYILRRKRLQKRRDNVSGSKGANKNPNNATAHIPTVSNPVYEDGSYANPADVQNDEDRGSGIKSIQSALYEQCLVVENPNAPQKIPSVYDNVNGKKTDHTYQDLDPAKREPSSKYQSLVKPTNDYSIVPGKRGATKPPVYTEPKNDGHVPVYTEPEKPVQEPVYNVLEDTNVPSGKKDTEPVYNVLYEDPGSNGKTGEPAYSVLEKSGEYDNI